MAASTKVPHLSVDERRARGKQVRDRTPPSSHSQWAAAADRPDPVGLLQEQNATREPDLVPVRHGACWSRRSPSTGARPRSWPPTWTARASLAGLAAAFGPTTALGEFSGLALAEWFRDRHAEAAPATWNRELATLRTTVAWWRRRGCWRSI